MRLLTIFGTRPEAVKLAPVLRALAREPAVESLICLTGQHGAALDSLLGLFGVRRDFDLRLEPAHGLNAFAGGAVARLDRVLAEAAPDRVIVQGDTTSATAAALAALHRGIPVAHVEAGLRTYRPRAPWPEEANRRIVDLLADLHFAPTRAARDHLAAERLHGRAWVTGNSGIDALLDLVARLEREPGLRRRADAALAGLDGRGRLVLVTAHRRESFGGPLRAVCAALAELAGRGDVEIAWPLHTHPEARGPAERALAGADGVTLLPPLDLPAFVRLLQRADLVVTDSGGVQEEAVALGKPLLVIRDATERSEAVRAGAARLVGTRRDRIVRQVAALLDAEHVGAAFERHPTLFGDGQAAARIVDGLLGRPVAEFDPEPLVTQAAE